MITSHLQGTQVLKGNAWLLLGAAGRYEELNMKAYVSEYRSTVETPQSIEVIYSGNPSATSTYQTRQAAEAVCRGLNSLPVRVGQHNCAFSTDPLPGGDFGVFCVCHPRL